MIEVYAESIATFFRERLEFYLRDVCGYAYDVVKAVLGSGCRRRSGCGGAGRGGEAGSTYAGVPGDRRGLQTHAEHFEAG